MSNTPEGSKGLNVLCIGELRFISTEGTNAKIDEDGGGVRGLSSLIVLQEIMRRVNATSGREIHPHEHFDVIAGTGTGG